MRALLVAAALLAGCAMPEAQRARLDPSNTQLAQGEGLLAARVVVNISPSPLNLPAASMTVVPANGSATRSLINKAAAGGNTALFLEPLPPGRYRLSGLVSGMGNITIRAPLDKLLADFDVQAGRVTDLGAVVLAFTSAGFASGKYRVGSLASPQDTDAVLATLPADARERLLGEPPLRAANELDPRGNAGTLAIARALASITVQAGTGQGEPALFGRTLGMVSLWDPKREAWTTLDSGRSFSVRSVALARDGTLLAGMDEGVLAAHKAGLWRTLPAPVPNASVLFVGQGAGGEYYALVESRTEFLVLSAPDPAGPWAELRRLPMQRFLNPGHNSRAQAALAADRLALIYFPGGAASPEMHTMVPATRQWDKTVLAHDGPFDILGDGAVVTTTGTAFNRALQWSRDWGRTWVRTPLENWAQLPTFVDARTVYMSRLDKIGAFSAANTVMSLMKSQDGGATWTSMGELPKFSTRLYALPKPGWLLLSTQLGQLYSSSNDGKSWAPQQLK